MQEDRIHYLEQTNREQRQIINDLEETIRALKRQDLETRVSLYNRLVRLSMIGHSNNVRKNIEMTDIVDKTIAEMWEDLKIDLYVENDEEGKIIELPNTDQSDR